MCGAKKGSSQDIYNALEKVIYKYDAWSSLKMIISCDTTVVNARRSNGVAAKIQRAMTGKGFDIPQYIGCQHYILERILRHVLPS